MDMVRRQRLPRRITVVVGIASLCGIVFVPFHLGSVTTIAPAAEHLVPLTAALPDPAPEWSGARHLIVVAGHAVYTAAGRDEHALSDEASWYLEPFQHAVLTRSLSLSLTAHLSPFTLTRYLEPFQHGQLSTMLSHIQRGVALAAADNASLLLFSGGETRASAGPRSEAGSYWEAADASKWFGRQQVRGRAALEAQARDSFENLLL